MKSSYALQNQYISGKCIIIWCYLLQLHKWSSLLQVLQRYYTQYLCGYDAIALNQLIQELQGLPEEESIILSSMCNEIGNLSVKQGEVCNLLE